MDQIVRVGEAVSSGMVHLCKGVVILCMCVIFGTLFAGIVSRELLALPLSFSEEVSLYAMVWLTMACTPLALYYGDHVSLTFLAESLPHTGQRVLRVIWYAVLMAACLVLISYCPSFVRGGFTQVLPTLPFLTQGGMYLAIPMGLAATAWVSLFKIGRILVSDPSGPSPGAQLPTA